MSKSRKRKLEYDESWWPKLHGKTDCNVIHASTVGDAMTIETVEIDDMEHLFITRKFQIIV